MRGESRVILGLFVVIAMLVTGCLFDSENWADGSGGIVPEGASTVANGLYAVRVKVETPEGKAWYPGVLKAGSPAMVCRRCFDGTVETTSEYQVYLDIVQWKPALAGLSIPENAVEFGDDNGTLHLVRALVAFDSEYAYGVLSDANQVPYVYTGNTWVPVPECEVLCSMVR